MNIYTIVILTALIAQFALGLIANLLNLRALRPELPEEFVGVYDAEAYRRSQEYTRVNTMFGFTTSTFQLLLALGFWFAGGFNYLDNIVRGWELGTILAGLAYIGIVWLAQVIIFIPFSMYRTFVIEERFGFNRTSIGTFIGDQLKGILLGLLIGAPAVAGVMYVFDVAGPMAWLYGWGAAAVFTLLLQLIIPTWIMPLFMKFQPLENTELKERLMIYSQKVNFPLTNIFVIDGSRRSSKANAFFTGIGRNRRIALYDTLIEGYTIPELEAVVAHEVGHYKLRHIVKGIVVSILHTGVFFMLLSVMIDNRGLFDAFFMEQISIHAGLIFFMMLVAPLEMLLGIAMNRISCRHEFEADHYAATTTGSSQIMIDALKKLSRASLTNLTPHPLLVFLDYNHPPMVERIQALRAIRL
ncbi:MAG: M48 family metallopeptidase [Armatimonadetes bacterium]|nr:M48 family metallopeptidase [Armatimonadota bacterium]